MAATDSGIGMGLQLHSFADRQRLVQSLTFPVADAAEASSCIIACNGYFNVGDIDSTSAVPPGKVFWLARGGYTFSR